MSDWLLLSLLVVLGFLVVARVARARARHARFTPPEQYVERFKHWRP